MFFKGSRYAEVKESTITDSKGRVIRYKRIRFIPETEGLTTHAVKQDERLDHVAYEHYHDPERFWRVCDANDAMWPDDLMATTGRKLSIPSSEE